MTQPASPAPDLSSTRLRLAILVLAYLAAHNLAYQFLIPTGVLAAIWPAAGMALAVILLTPRAWWPGMLAALALINLGASLLAGRSLPVSLGFVVTHFFETLVGGLILSRRDGRPVTFERVSDVRALILVTTLGNTLVAVLAAATVWLNFGEPFWRAYWTWWISNGLGVLLVTPLVVVWVNPGGSPEGSAGRADHWHTAEHVAFVVCWSAASWLIFHAAPTDWTSALHPYMLLPLLAWAGLRLGQRAVTAALAIVAAVAVAAITGNLGSSPLGGTNEAARLLLLQVFLGVTAITSLLLAASLAQAQHEVRERKAGEALLRQFIRHAPAAVAMFDREMRYVQASDRWLSDYRLSGEVAGRLHYDVFPDVPERWKQIHQRVLAGAVERCEEDPFPRADGTTEWLQWEVRPWRDARGDVGGVVIYTQVITERKRAEQALRESDAERRKVEEQLRQSQKMEAIGQLAGGVAHDFNNILSVIMMQAELAAASPSLPSDVREFLDEITMSADRASSLTRQLLAFSRRQVMQPRDLDVNDAITHLAQMLRRILGEDVGLQLSLHRGTLLTHADPGMFDQIVMNLAVNARDAMPAGGRLLIETSLATVAEDDAGAAGVPSPGQYVCIRVSDTGEGIPAEHLARIFEPFFTTKAPGKGTGLGLATVFGIVQQHRGTVRVYSEVGQGTTFAVLLPLKASAEPGHDVHLPAHVPGGDETVLVVEDEPGIRALTRRVLERHGYTVVEASSGPAALQAWEERRGRIDLLLTDMVMPGGLTGRELASQLQQRDPSMRVLFTSGYSAELAGQSLVLEEGHNFLQKPHGTGPLLEAVRRCLDA